MTDQPRDIRDIMKDRIDIIQAIAAANTQHLRLNQEASGFMVLDMKDERDGVEDPAHDAARKRNDAALDDNLQTINRLDAKLSALDEELETAMKEHG
ncbi:MULTISPECIES: hypothetical protein [unclassified Marinovum]